MKLIRSLMGRRQFLIAASLTSTLGLVSKKLASVFGPGFQGSIAKASNMAVSDVRAASYNSGTSGMRGGNNRYSHLLSPLVIRNKVLKNRMVVAPGYPNHQGPECYPTKETRSIYARTARNGAIVHVRRVFGGGGFSAERVRQQRLEAMGDARHGVSWDTEDPAVENYVDAMIEGIHVVGSLVNGGTPQGNTVDEVLENAIYLESRGVDVVYIPERYSDFLNDKKMRLFIDQMQGVRKATDLLIMLNIDIKDPEVEMEPSDYNVRKHYTLEQAIEIAKAYEGSADILYFKTSGGSHNHPTGFVMDKDEPRVIYASQAIKESGAKIITAPNGGFREPDLCEEYIASGKTDMVSMCRAFISDWEYTQKLKESRGEDTVPCIKCNKCHHQSMDGPWYALCSVNPRVGTTEFLEVITPPTASKKVAIIGGGPAGMRAAMTAVERGHGVTLYEKNNKLGGLLRHADYSPYSWPLKDFKDYLIRQLDKLGVEVILGTEATPEMIRSKGYDAVLAATGAEPVMPRIPGAETSDVWNFFDVFANEKALGKDVIFVGGGKYGAVATGMFLARAGHNVTVLTPEKELYRNVMVHYPEGVMWTYDRMKTYDYFTDVVATRISKGKVTYVDVNGKEKSIQGDSVVIYAGLRSRQEEALAFCDTAKEFLTAGDCTERGGNIQRATRNAFFTASQI